MASHQRLSSSPDRRRAQRRPRVGARALACPTYAGLAALRQAFDGGRVPHSRAAGAVSTDAPTFRLLASPRLEVGVTHFDVPDSAPGYLLAYLAARADWVRREEVATLMWPDAGEQAAQHNLRVNLNRLRPLLGKWCVDDALVAEQRRLRVALPNDVAAMRAAHAAGDWPVGGRHSARRLPRQPELPRVSGARRVGTHRAAEPAGTLARGAAARRPGAASGTDDGTRASLSRSRSDGRGGAARAVERTGRYGPTCRSGGVLRPIRRAVAARMRRDSRRRAAATGGTHPGAARDRGCRGRRHGIVRGGPGARACRAPPALSEGRGP